MFSVSLALVVLWTQSPALALVLVGPLVAVALHQRATHNALRAMRLALTDPLTGLGNHRHFQEQLQVQLEEASAAREPLTVCLFDLDDFKQINDRYGHPVGDRVLAHVAGKLRGIGEAYRLGGDEFAVVFPRTRADAAAAAAEELVRALGEEEWEQGGPLRVTAGIATYPDHSNDRNALVRVADIALYWAKGEGKNRVCVYRPDMPAVTQLRRLTRAPDRAARLQAAAALASAVDARDAFEGSHSTRVGDLAAGDRRAAPPARGGGRADPPRRPAARHRQARRARGDPAQAGPAHAAREGRAREPSAGRPRDAAAARHRARADVGAAPPRALGRHRRARRSSPASASRSGARIIFAADAWDAMTNARPYSPAQSADEARDELRRCSGRQFDPVVVAALLDEVCRRRRSRPSGI